MSSIRIMLPVLGLGLVWSPGCATTAGPSSALKAPELRTVAVKGVVVATDGRAVPRAKVEIVCGQTRLIARTDDEGRFALQGVPAQRCGISVAKTRAAQIVDLGNLLRAAPEPLRIVVPGPRRVTFALSWKEGKDSKVRVVVLDETIPGPGTFDESTVRFAVRHPQNGAEAKIVIDLKTSTAKVLPARNAQLPMPRKVVGLPKISDIHVASRIELPLTSRGAPRQADTRSLPLSQANGIVELQSLLGQRTVVWVGRCAGVRSALKRDLAGLLGSYQRVGLRAVVITTDACSATALPRATVKANSLAVYEGGPAALWALKAKAGDLLVLDASGSRLWRQALGKDGAIQAAVAYLKTSWPLFAATERVSVRRAKSIAGAKEHRLLGQAGKLVAKGDYRGAHKLLDRVLEFSPTHAEAHRQRALMNAVLGDLTGAMNDVGWWRDSFGDEAADELMDLVKKRASAKAATY